MVNKGSEKIALRGRHGIEINSGGVAQFLDGAEDGEEGSVGDGEQKKVTEGAALTDNECDIEAGKPKAIKKPESLEAELGTSGTGETALRALVDQQNGAIGDHLAKARVTATEKDEGVESDDR
jgi:hypothetical protein